MVARDDGRALSQLLELVASDASREDDVVAGCEGLLADQVARCRVVGRWDAAARELRREVAHRGDAADAANCASERKSRQ